jgi:hypothetical protein
VAATIGSATGQFLAEELARVDAPLDEVDE